jgi:hypothetical protein
MFTNTIKDFTIKYTDVDTERMSSTEIQDNDRSKGQRIAYLEYNHEKFGSNQPLVIQFPWIRIVNYGVPKMDERFFKNDSERAFIKIPLDDNIPESAELIKMLIKLDELFSSKKFCEHLFGKKYEKYIKGYVPIYRKPVLNEDEDNDDDSKKKLSKSTIPKYPYMKVKIDTDYTTGEIKTKLYRSELIDNKRIRTELQEIKTIDDFAREVCWNSNIRIIIRFVKIWAQPLTKKDPIWGATFKIMKVEVEPPIKSNSLYKDYMNSDAFLDSDEETNNLPNVPIPIPVPTKKVKQVESDDSDEKPKSPKKVAQVESNDSDKKHKLVKQVESDDSEEEKPKIVKKVAQVESDDDDSEEEKPKIVKKVAQVESDDDDSEEEKPKIVKKVAQVESDDSEESEEEKPPPPTKKSVAKTTGRGGKSKST